MRAILLVYRGRLTHVLDVVLTMALHQTQMPPHWVLSDMYSDAKERSCKSTIVRRSEIINSTPYRSRPVNHIRLISDHM